jgi:hypothetical protein
MNCVDSPFVDVRVAGSRPIAAPPIRSVSAASILLLLLLCLGLAGCGSSERGQGYSDRPPSNRTAYVAWQEWTRFGRSTVVYGGRPAATPIAAGVSERSEPLSSRVGDYWGSCGHPEWNGRTSGRPWSGAFVTWVMAQSGVSARRSRAPAGTASISPRSTIRSTVDGRASRCMRPTNTPQAGRSRLHRHRRSDLAPCRFAHRAAAHRHHGEPLRRRHRRARRLRAGDRRQREGQRHDEPLSGRFARPARATPGKIWMMVVENRAN